MSYEKILTETQSFIREKPIFSQALSELKPGTEIRILVENREEFSLFFKDGQPHFEHRAAKGPDVEFKFSADAIRLIVTLPGDDMAVFGIEVLRLILDGSVKIRVCGNVFNVLTGGYLNIIRAAGPDFMKFLASYGFKGISKLIALIRTLKS